MDKETGPESSSILPKATRDLNPGTWAPESTDLTLRLCGVVTGSLNPAYISLKGGLSWRHGFESLVDRECGSDSPETKRRGDQTWDRTLGAPTLRGRSERKRQPGGQRRPEEVARCWAERAPSGCGGGRGQVVR